MIEWSEGYVNDVGYTYGYYPELNPLYMKLAFLEAGLVVPKVGVACELGFGQGVSVNLHAAASVVSWYGTDFLPAQASFAQELVSVSGVDTKLYDEAFDAFCGRVDLPEFDYIGLHGIWSWISDKNREVIVDFVRRKLRVGGVVYTGYNTQPGWAAMIPFRDLLNQHATVMSADGSGTMAKIDNAMVFADQLVAANPRYVVDNPLVKAHLERVKTQNRNYVAHEYFNRDWAPMGFAKMTEWFAPAKVQWACSANYLDAVNSLCLTADQEALLNSIPDLVLRQTVRDFCVNQQFRKDFWVKGARSLNAFEQAEQLRAQRVILVVPSADVSLKVVGHTGSAQMQKTIYGPIIDALADHKVRSLGQLEQTLKGSDSGNTITFAQLLQAVMVLSSNGTLLAAQDETVVQKTKKQTALLNRHLMMKARVSGDIVYWASPVTGGGVKVARFPQLFLLAREQGTKDPKDWAQFASEILASQGQRILKDGKALETKAEHLVYLTEMAEEFAAKQLPILRALKVA